jgi:hypothetical protein
MSGAAQFRVGLVFSARPWPSRLHAFVADHVPDVELVLVRDERAALDSGAQILLVDDTTPWLTSGFIGAAKRSGMRLVGVYDRSEGGGGRERLAQLGLTHLLEAAMPVDDVVFLLDRLRPTVTDASTPGAAASADGGDRSGELVGDVVEVGGASGSGAREVAVALAAEWGWRDWSTVLVDLNETTPGVARRLGLAAVPHVLSAIDAVRSDGGPAVRSAVAETAPGALPFDVIAGLPTPRDWDALVPDDVELLLTACSREWRRVVVTSSPLIEDLHHWVDRFAVSRRTLGVADAVVGCCEPSPRGVLRFLDWCGEVAGLRSSLIGVINKVPRSRRAAAEVTAQVGDVAGVVLSAVHEVPFDRSVASAEWDGTLVRRGRFCKAVSRLADAVDSVLVADAVIVTEVVA